MSVLKTILLVVFAAQALANHRALELRNFLAGISGGIILFIIPFLSIAQLKSPLPFCAVMLGGVIFFGLIQKESITEKIFIPILTLLPLSGLPAAFIYGGAIYIATDYTLCENPPRLSLYGAIVSYIASMIIFSLSTQSL